jgi:hypothetical protein
MFMATSLSKTSPKQRRKHRQNPKAERKKERKSTERQRQTAGHGIE